VLGVLTLTNLRLGSEAGKIQNEAFRIHIRLQRELDQITADDTTSESAKRYAPNRRYGLQSS
jgi:hypothetical protein